MARVIKSQKDPSEQPSPEQEAPQVQSGPRVIEKEHYLAEQEAKRIVKEGEQEKIRRYEAGRKKAHQSKEEAMAKAATKAFSNAGKEAVNMFRARAHACEKVSKEAFLLAEMIVKKILGPSFQISETEKEKYEKSGLKELLAKRKIKIQLPPGQLAHIPTKAQFVDLEESEDVGEGFARVITDVGSALCKEADLLEAYNDIQKP